MHRARAAQPATAAVFRAAQLQLVAQHPQQGRVGIDVDHTRLAVDAIWYRGMRQRLEEPVTDARLRVCAGPRKANATKDGTKGSSDARRPKELELRRSAGIDSFGFTSSALELPMSKHGQ